jgi:hypothetical protein
MLNRSFPGSCYIDRGIVRLIDHRAALTAQTLLRSCEFAPHRTGRRCHARDASGLTADAGNCLDKFTTQKAITVQLNSSHEYHI